MPSNEEKTSSDDTSDQPQTLRQRDPPMFSLIELDDMEGWIDGYERVAGHNRWDVEIKLVNVVFSVSAFRTADAKHRLPSRTREGSEAFTAYIEDVLALSKRAGPSMPDLEKMRDITKGICYDIFNMIVLKNPMSVAKVVILCKTLQDSHNTRMKLFPASPILNDKEHVSITLTLRVIQDTAQNMVRVKLWPIWASLRHL